MVKFLVSRPVAVLVSFFALMLLGLASFWFIPASLLPDTDVPVINVRLKGDNLSARDVENRLTRPIRSSLLQLHGLKRMESSSTEGQGNISLIFEHGTNTSLAFIEVNEKVDMAMNRLPRDAERPMVIKSDINDIPVFYLNIYPKKGQFSESSLAQTSSLAHEVIGRRLEQLPEISMVDITGLSQPEIQLLPKAAYLQSIGLNAGTLSAAFEENKINLGSIMVKEGNYRYFMKFSAELQSLESIENIPLNIEGRLFKLSDLAEVRMANAEAKGSFFANGKRAINIAVFKQSSAKMADLDERFNELLNHLKEDYPDLNFSLSQDQTFLLDFSISNLQQDLLLGAIFAFLLMLVFIRKIRSAMLIAITIPMSLIISQLGFYLLDISINIISLGGLILGLGMIIDNSIVVIDNINRHRLLSKEIDKAAIDGTNEIVRPLITSVLTNCAVFIPLIFMSGLAGDIFYDQAISITIGVFASLVVAILLLPPLYCLFYNAKSKNKTFEIKSYVNITRWYETGLAFTFKHKKTAFLLVLLLFVLGMALFRGLRKSKIPDISRQDFELTINWDGNIHLSENKKRVLQLLGQADELIAEANVWLGEQQYIYSKTSNLEYTQAKLYVKARKVSDLAALKNQLANIIKQTYPNALLNFRPAKNAFDQAFYDDLAPLKIQLSSEEKDMPSIEQSQSLTDTLNQVLPNARIDRVELTDRAVLSINTRKAALYGISPEDIRRQIESKLKPIFVDNFQGSQALIPIVIANPEYTSLYGMLSSTFVKSKSGAKILLSALVNLRSEKTYSNINAGVQGEYYPINIYTASAGKDLPRINRVLEKHSPNMEAVVTGSYFSNQKLIREMAGILLVSVLLLYFILAAQFESLTQPLFILAELPVAISGAFILLYVGGGSINLMSMIGIVIMCGLIINDSILKIDAINQLRKQRMPLMEAIVEGGHKRLKPIVMICLTSIGVLLPTLFMDDLGSELQQPLALALIGGMLIGTLISLFFVPLLYWMVYRKKDEQSDLNFENKQHG